METPSGQWYTLLMDADVKPFDDVRVRQAFKLEFLVLDEPTTGLDVVTQARVLDLLEEIRRDLGVAVVYVSHDLGVIARTCRHLAVIYAGRVIETGETAALYAQPAHPYTRALLAAVPRLTSGRLPSALPGAPPAPGEQVAGCAFAPRCAFAETHCRSEAPALEPVAEGRSLRQVRCHQRVQVLAAGPVRDSEPGAPERSAATGEETLVELEDLDIDYAPAGLDALIARLLGRLRGAPERVPTVAGVTLSVRRGETLALVGESGSGKSTIAWTIAGLHRPRAGRVRLGGTELAFPVRRRPAALRRGVQLVFQNPEASLNPRHRIGLVLERPLQLFSGLGRRRRQERVVELLEEVGLGGFHAQRFPLQLSGGQRQRVGIARALAAKPDLILCDEVVSALDVSVQAAVLGLLDRLRAEHQVTYLFISHDLAVVRALADRVAVLYLGRLCEEGRVEDVYRGPHHPYTELLLSSVLKPDPGAAASAPVQVDEAEPAPPPRGCVFQGRCPRKLGRVCEEEAPPWRVTGAGHRIRCHLELDQLGDIVPGFSRSESQFQQTKEIQR